MDYPFPGLPPEITQEIALRDPQAYARLSSTSRRLRQSLLPKLEEICNSRISPEEIARYYRAEIKPKSQISLDLYTPLGNDPLLSGIYINRNNQDNNAYYQYSYNRQLTPTEISGEIKNIEVTPFIRDLLQQGYRPDLQETYNILMRRQSCQRFPHFALRRIWREFLDRLNHDLPIIRRMLESPLANSIIQDRVSMPFENMAKLIDADIYYDTLDLISNIRQQDPATKLQSLLDYLPILEKRINSLSP